MRQYFLQYVTNSTSNSYTCCNTHWWQGLHMLKLKRLQFQHFKNFTKNLKCEIKIKVYGTTKRPFTPNIYLRPMYLKIRLFFAFMEWLHLCHC